MSAPTSKYNVVERDSNRTNDRLEIINELLNISGDTPLINTYLDIGCGDATISKAISESVKSKITYCADVILPDIKDEKKDIEYLKIDEKNPKLEILADCVDLITCLVSMHHFRNLEMMISEIDRVSKIGAYLLIREHDADSSLQPYLDFIHLIYLAQKELDPATFYSSYYKKSDLQRSLENHGWKYLQTYSYTNKNPQKIYHSLFIFTGIKEKWNTPATQTTKYTITAGNLMKYISALSEKKIYINVLKKQGYTELQSLQLLNIISISSFMEKIKAIKLTKKANDEK